MTRLIVMCGISGAGKSTWARAYTALNPGTVLVSTDEIRGELFGDESKQDKSELVFATAFDRINSALAGGHDVVFDAMSITQKARNQLLKEIHGADRRSCVCFKTPLEVALRNQRKRFRRVPAEVVKSQQERFVYPTYAEGWDDIYDF